MIPINTELFRCEAKDFLRQGYYCPDPPGSPPFMEYWGEQLRRCKEGYSVGGMQITGDHYGYLNFGQIRLTLFDNQNAKVTKKKLPSSGRKIVSFPDFWDGDYDYFWNEQIAENGIEKEKLQKLELLNTPLWTDGGHHMLVAKARRKGFSYKNGFIAANRYNTQRNFTTLIGAFEKKYLYPEGTMKMSSDYLNFFNEHTGWSKRRQAVDKQDHRKASYYEYINNLAVEKGYKSQIIAITFKDNPDAARGKDAGLILMEEGGKFNNLKAAFMATKPTVEDGSITTGIIIIFGTGGDMEGGTIDFESMFYNPEAYNIMPYVNIYDDNMSDTSCGFFFPDYRNKIGFIDKQGFSLVEAAKKYEKEKREHIKKTAKSPAVYDKHITEYPWNPREAFLQHNQNIFPTILLNEWKGELISRKKDREITVHGELYDKLGDIKFRPTDSVRPIEQFPHNSTDDLTGCISIIQPPYRDADGNVPPGMYILFHDPYAHDTETGTGSLGATYVYKFVNNKSRPDDMLVAYYVGRPGSQDEYNRNLFMLAQYYNAKIGFENDRGEVIPYAKRFKQLGRLMGEVEIVDKSENVKIRKLGRKYGQSMGSIERKGQACVYLRDWLLTKRHETQDGKEILNLHMIHDIPLLDELIRYNMKGNFDRVSALLVGMYYIKDAHLRIMAQLEEENQEYEEEFFDRDFF